MTAMYNNTSTPRWTTTALTCITKPMMSHLEIDGAEKALEVVNSRTLAAAA
jgi:hypothetical protein